MDKPVALLRLHDSTITRPRFCSFIPLDSLAPFPPCDSEGFAVLPRSARSVRIQSLLKFYSHPLGWYTVLTTGPNRFEQNNSISARVCISKSRISSSAQSDMLIRKPSGSSARPRMRHGYGNVVIPLHHLHRLMPQDRCNLSQRGTIYRKIGRSTMPQVVEPEVL